MIKTENKIQQEILISYTNKYCLKTELNRSLIFAIPNGGFRNVREAATLKQTGTLAGVSDMIIIHAPHNSKLYFIELKTPIGKQSPAQIEFENRVKALGYSYLIFNNVKDFNLFFNI